MKSGLPPWPPLTAAPPAPPSPASFPGGNRQPLVKLIILLTVIGPTSGKHLEKQQKILLTGQIKEHLSVWKVRLEQEIMRKMAKSTLLLKFGQTSSKFFTNLTKKTRKIA